MAKTSRKAFGYFVRTRPTGIAQLLVLRASDRPTMPFRIPGGTLIDGEAPEKGMRRELFEETGLSQIIVRRKLGVQYYFKAFIEADVERHDFLVTTADELPDSFVHVDDNGGNSPACAIVYTWLDPDRLSELDDEFRRHLTPDYLSEWFL